MYFKVKWVFKAAFQGILKISSQLSDKKPRNFNNKRSTIAQLEMSKNELFC